MLDNTIKVRITNEELYRLGFEKVIYNGKEYVDKSPLFLDSTCPLSQAYYELAARKAYRQQKAYEARKEKEKMKKKRK